ncbi:MAG TPA: hypothetical protein PK511_09730 [Chitinophagales bacterium]|nr:hypothetical protein [Chitinophagales bacterium]HMZ89451.1 hypothetical protein [Chitinophagales bacterium]HNI54789.1 hypothetical protein [Chitinophagales bacterium]HNK98497.1 hypothetical protein [Chitinophagales bacterium]HNM28838.1 hypothetical protein [Chitinophagales bacterium]
MSRLILSLIATVTFILLTSMSACMKYDIERRANPSNIEVYDSIYLKNGNYCFWYAYNLGGIYGGIGDYISIAPQRSQISDSTQVIVSEYIKGIRAISENEIVVILTEDEYDEIHTTFKGIKISAKID